SNITCTVQVEWHQYNIPNKPACDIDLDIEPGKARTFCSRIPSNLFTEANPITVCHQTCEQPPSVDLPKPELEKPLGPTPLGPTPLGPAIEREPILLEGKAIVSSTQESACSRIAVDARVYYTTGTNNEGDTAVVAISNSKIVFIDEGNLGD